MNCRFHIAYDGTMEYSDAHRWHVEKPQKVALDSPGRPLFDLWNEVRKIAKDWEPPLFVEADRAIGERHGFVHVFAVFTEPKVKDPKRWGTPETAFSHRLRLLERAMRKMGFDVFKEFRWQTDWIGVRVATLEEAELAMWALAEKVYELGLEGRIVSSLP